MAFPVKWYSGAMQGAPAWPSTQTAGNLISLLKAILVTGFGNSVVSSLSYNSTTQLITAVVAAGHKYLQDSIINIAGANEAGYNGEFRVVSVTSTTVVLACDNGVPSSSSATGTLSISYPSLGWAIEFEDAPNNLIIFKRVDPASTPIRLRIDNSAWTNYNINASCLAKVQMVEDVADINTFTTVLDRRWPASGYQATANDYLLVGDSLLFYFMPRYGVDQKKGFYYFGDINSIRAGDKYHCILSYYHRPVYSDSSGYNWGGSNNAYSSDGACFQNSNHKTFARSYHQIFGAVSAYYWGYRTYFGEGLTFPNPADNGFYVSVDKIPVMDDKGLRGFMPGLAVPYQLVTAYDMKVVSNLPNLPNSKILFATTHRSYTDTSNVAMVGFDIKGPWR